MPLREYEGVLDRFGWNRMRPRQMIFPKTETPERLTEKLEIFDFELSDDEMTKVTGLDRGQRTGPNPTSST